MKSKVIILCVLLFCSKFVASSPFNEDSVRQWQGSQNNAENYHGTGFARTQNINSMTNSAQYADSQEYNANQGGQIYDNYGFKNQASPQQALPVKEAVNFATDDVQAYPIRNNNPIRVNNQQYTQHQWQHQNRFVNSASSANRGYAGGYDRPLIPARQPSRPFINGPGQPIHYVPNHQNLHYHPIREHSGSLPGPVRYENYNEPHAIASNMNRVPGNNGYGGNPPPYTYNGAIPASAPPNNRNSGYREVSVINPGPKYPIQNTYRFPITPPNLPPDNNGPPQVPFTKYPAPNNPVPINDYNGAPILPNPNSSPPMPPIPPIPSDEYDENPTMPIDKTLDSYKNPGESYPDTQPAPTNPGPPSDTNYYKNLYHHYSTAANHGNINDFLSSSKVQDLLSERTNRYLILHPNGTVDYIDKLDEISQKYPNYIVVNKNNNTSTVVSQSQSSNPPPADVKPAQNILDPVRNNETDSSPQPATTPTHKSYIPLIPSNYNYQHHQESLTNNSSSGTSHPTGNHHYHPYNPKWDKNAHPSKHPTPVFTTTTSLPTPDAEVLKEFLDYFPNDTNNNSATTPEVPNGSDYNPTTKSSIQNDNDNDKDANKPPNAQSNLPTTTTLSEEDLFMKRFLDSLTDQPSDDEPSNNDNDNKNKPDIQKNSFTTQPWKLHTVISSDIVRTTTASSKDRHSPSDVTISPIETTTDQIITLSPIETSTDNLRYDTQPNSDDQGENNNSTSSSKTNTNVNSDKDDTIPCPHKANKQKVDDNDDETTRTVDKNKKTTAFNDSLTKTEAPATTDDSSAVTTIAPNQNDVNTVDSSTTGDNWSEFQLSDIKLSINIPDDPNGNITISIEVPESTGNEDGQDSGTLILSVNTPESSSKNTTSTSSDDDDGTDNGFDKNKSHVIDLLNSVVVCSTTNSTDVMNKMNANNSSCNVMYVIQMAPPNQPRIEKNKETTYFANGTVVEEYTETTWQDENTPVTVTMKKVYHRDPVH